MRPYGRGPWRPSFLLGFAAVALAALLAGARIADGQARVGAVEGPPAPDPPLEVVIARAHDAPELATMAAGLVDSVGGRLSGTAAGVRAEAWAARWLRRLGFENVRQENVPMPVWRRGTASVRVAAPAILQDRRLVAIAYGYSPGVRTDSVPVLDIGLGDTTALRAAGEAATGSAVLTDMVNPPVVEVAAEMGVAALLRVSFEPGRLPQARTAPIMEPPAPLPLLVLSHEDGLWLRRQRAAGPVAVGLHVDAVTESGMAHNVVAELVGRDPDVGDEVVLLGAHLDAWDVGDGALDNGSGVLTVMGAAQGLASLETRPRRTVRVVLFAGEELGLFGSREYVRAHAGELDDVVAMMNLDMVGAPQGYGATGHPEADTLFARLARHPRLKAWGLSEEVDHGGGAGSDHQPFLLAGVPTVYVRSSLSADALRWYHNAGDTLDKLKLADVRRAAGAAAAAVWTLADHPGRPLRHLTPQETRELVESLGWLGR